MKFLLLVTMVTVSFAADGSDWSYGNQEAWGGVCNKGTRESPIDITKADKVMTYTEEIEFPAKVEIEVLKVGLKTVQISIISEDPAIIKMPSTWPVGNKKGLEALQLHLHWGRKGEKGSEHFLGGKQFDGEAHLVCRNLDQEDETAGDAYAVFGIFLEEDGEGDPGSAHLLEILNEESTAFYLPRIYTKDELSDVFTYEGGLTTPGCNEMVFWHVTPHSLHVSADLMAKLRSYGGSAYDLNYRELQPLNERKITWRMLGSPFATPQEDDSQHCDMDCYAAEQKCRWSNTAATIFPSISLLLIALFSLY